MKIFEKKYSINSRLILLFLLLLVGFKILIFKIFAFQFTDDDQALMMQGLYDFSKGKFYEPRFYGQSYNTLIEALLAIPLYKLGVSPWKAITIITSILSIIPFLFIVTFNRKKKVFVLFVISFLLSLPLEYDLITTMPRGFVTGLAFASFSFYAFYNVKNTLSYFLLGLSLVVSYSFNANALLITLPITFYVFLHSMKNIKFYLFILFGFLLGIIFHYFSIRFYLIHPEYIVHQYEMAFSFDFFKQGITNLDRYLNHVSPIFWKQGFGVLIIFILMAILSYRQQKLALFWTIVSIIIMIPVTMFASKIHDGTDDIFFPYSRMYLGIPILIPLIVSKLKFSLNKYFYLLLIIPLSLAFKKYQTFNEKISYYEFKNGPVLHARNSIIDNELKKIDLLMKTHHCDLVLIKNHWLGAMLAYSSESLGYDFPILLWNHDRRFWKRNILSTEFQGKVLVIDSENSLPQNDTLIKVNEYYYLLEVDKKTMISNCLRDL